MLFYRKPRFLPLPRQAHPLLRRGLGRLSPSFPLFLSATIQNGNFIVSLWFLPSLKQPISNEKYEVLQYSSPANHDSQPYPARHIPSFGGAWGGRPSFFKYFRPLPHSLANIENMSTLFSVKIPLFCPSLQQLLQSTNSLLFIFSLLFPLIASSYPPSVVSSLPISPDRHVFQCTYNNINIYKRINLFTFLWFYFLCYLSLSIKMYIIKNMINYLCCYVYA